MTATALAMPHLPGYLGIVIAQAYASEIRSGSASASADFLEARPHHAIHFDGLEKHRVRAHPPT